MRAPVLSASTALADDINDAELVRIGYAEVGAPIRTPTWTSARDGGRNTGHNSRKGAVRERVQALNPVTKRYIKIDTNTGRIIDQKKSAGPYKGIRGEKPSGKT